MITDLAQNLPLGKAQKLNIFCYGISGKLWKSSPKLPLKEALKSRPACLHQGGTSEAALARSALLFHPGIIYLGWEQGTKWIRLFMQKCQRISLFSPLLLVPASPQLPFPWKFCGFCGTVSLQLFAPTHTFWLQLPPKLPHQPSPPTFCLKSGSKAFVS